ncbi:MAG: 2,3-diphosphoglycerate-dependent phosphoglycerate mutase [Candidatus Dasytiphilus stammeri]
MIVNKIIFLRHGESEWNKKNCFSGWYDINLSEKGEAEAKLAGQVLKQEGWYFDYAFTSVLKRAIQSLGIILDVLDQSWLPIEKSWKLNERHYGALQGMNKNDMTNKYGLEKINQWRRGWNYIPPALKSQYEKFSGHDFRYAYLNNFPLTESLEFTSRRVISYWKEVILPRFKLGQSIIITAHGNSLRALLKYLNYLTANDIIYVTIPTGVPIVYEFNKDFQPTRYYYLFNVSH